MADAVGIDALVQLAKSGELGRVRALLTSNFLLASQRLPSGESPLMAALYRGHHDIVEALIDAGAEIDIFAAAATGRMADLRREIARESVTLYAYDGWTPLHLAAFFGHLGAARLLVEAGADVHAVSRNGLSNTPLHAATSGRHSDVAMYLLERGASGSAVDSGGYTPLQIASENGLAEIVATIKRG
jgi:ankyrin repeat protein